ncbi:hypothetical protein BDB01DRAFT_853607 [Pilobolus umbonatus]|nr:hypothetical protein BDB01DRAFT_853607 [Pilobolus umbonatus]
MNPYYGSRQPLQSIGETDRVIFKMMDDMHAATLLDKEKEDVVEEVQTQKSHPLSWRCRIVTGSILIIFVVLGTIVASELSKQQGK